MEIIKTVEKLIDIAVRERAAGKSIGMVPTMGALHEGHLSLIRRAHEENDVVFCSIFVNPVQFNNAEDLAKYPRTLEADVQLIGDLADYVFAPTVEEVFPVAPTEVYDFGTVANVMEGAARPRHFNGVGVIVRRLLEWVRPHKAYFGEKDYQQIAVIREMCAQCRILAEIVSCPIVREPNGLAMSSRNRRLSAHEFETAANIHRILEESKKFNSLQEIKQFVETEIAKIPEFQLDYFELADAKTLLTADTLDTPNGVMGFITVYVGPVRLIDNVKY